MQAGLATFDPLVCFLFFVPRVPFSVATCLTPDALGYKTRSVAQPTQIPSPTDGLHKTAKGSSSFPDSSRGNKPGEFCFHRIGFLYTSKKYYFSIFLKSIIFIFLGRHVPSIIGSSEEDCSHAYRKMCSQCCSICPGVTCTP